MAKLVQQLVEAVRRFVYQILFPLLLAIFGEIRWSPPQWFRRVADAVRRGATKSLAWLSASRARSAVRFWASVSALVLVIGASLYAWHWYRNLPEPHYIEASVIEPPPTLLESDEETGAVAAPIVTSPPTASSFVVPPGRPDWRRHRRFGHTSAVGVAPAPLPDAAQGAVAANVPRAGTIATAPANQKPPLPYPLRIQFSGSAARLDAVGKKVTSGITISPRLDGSWAWENDSLLVFTPARDWEVGRYYTILFDKKLFPSHVLMRRYKYPFRTPAFQASIDSTQFYEDPTDPKIKKVAATVRFTHPVDKSDFEKRIAFRMRVEPVKSFDSDQAKSFGFTVTYNQKGWKAFIQSDSFAIPNNEGEMLLTIAKGARSSRGGPGTTTSLERTVHVPGIASYFRIQEVSASEVENERSEIERICTITSSAPMRQSDLAKYVSVFLLPKDKPAIGNEAKRENFHWSDALEAVPEVMALATPVKIEWIPTEHEFSNVQSFRFVAESGRSLLVAVKSGLRSFGDYPLVKDHSQVVEAEPLPKTIKIVSEGSLLSLSGEKKISILTRGVDSVQIDVSRLLPDTVSHLVGLSGGTFSNPQFLSYFQNSIGLDDLSQVFTEVRHIGVNPAGRNQYIVFDFAPLMSNGALPHGLFSIKVTEWVEKKKSDQTGDDQNESNQRYGNEQDPSRPSDQRLILLTDLGLLVKDSLDGTHDLFVQSIRTGAPVSDVQIQVLGRNGLPLLTEKTSAEGRVAFPNLKDLTHERTPTVYVAEKDGDFSFLPYARSDRQLNLSRFDTGGEFTSPAQESLQAYLFSDRGIYRPGDPIHVGIIVKPNDWKPLLAGLPLRLIVSDPRDVEIRDQVVKVSATGFEEFSLDTREGFLTGSYHFSLYVVRDDKRKALLGSTSVRVEDFQPDRMSIKAELSAPTAAGWVSPDKLGANVLLRNLFGTPAAVRRVKGSLKLAPSAAGFAKYADYLFFDQYQTAKSYDEDLGEVETDAGGRAKFDFNLEKFEKGLYRLRFVAEGFEPEGGRSVLADASAVVSPAPYLIAYKADGDLGYIKKDSLRSVHLIAVDPKLDMVAIPAISAELIEIRYVSVLTKQESGTLAYQSVRKEISLQKKDMVIPASGLAMNLPTGTAGSFAFVLRNAHGDELNRISFEVVGQGNVRRSLEREAELKIRLDKPEYSPGDEAEVDIQAPYVGAGLITVERDRVYAVKWFKTATTESVQKINIPAELEGNGYITVTFVRDLTSREIFTSPLSYGSVPFNISRARRKQGITLEVPKLIRPGDTLHVQYQSDGPARIAIFAVDEGILQVARYHTPDPLSYFFRKRALEVTTSQILDLILPELHLLNEVSAAGGDEEGLRAHQRNPFKRKGQKPVAFWSGLIDSDGKPGSIDIPMPDYFNGTIRVMAVAVSPDGIGIEEHSVVAQGYFVIQPQAPYFATPGDEFEVTAMVANNLTERGEKAGNVKVELKLGKGLEAVGDDTQMAEIPPGTDSTVRFRVRAGPIPGAPTMTIHVSGGGKSSSYTLDMSIRPASPYVTTVSSGYVKKGLLTSVKADLPLTRPMYPQYREVEVSASSIPLGLAYGMIRYLKKYPYGCTEQIVSEAFAAVVLGARSEFGLSRDDVKTAFEHAIETLEARQNADGSFGLWQAGPDVVPFINVYAAHFLLEAREHGFDVPHALFDRSFASLRAMVTTPGSNLPELRAQAYALYLLTRNGVVLANQLASLREKLDRDYKDQWRSDITVAYLAASYSQLKMDKEGYQLLGYARALPPISGESDYCDELVNRATYLYLVSKHFPDDARKLSGGAILALADPIVHGQENTLSSAYAILALDAYAKAAGPIDKSKIAFSTKYPDGSSRPLSAIGDLIARADVPGNARTVHLEGDTNFVLFYQLLEAGFDLKLPQSEIKNQIEIAREYRTENDEAVNSIPLDSKVRVVVSVRAIAQPVSNVAIVDLLPGGLEVDISPEGIGDRRSLVQSPNTWTPDYIDVREDRVIFYGTIGTNAQTFIYRMRPTNLGNFVVPPLYAEGMYDRSVQARSMGSVFKIVEAPKVKP
jgi:alpha-2-macroglobulin